MIRKIKKLNGESGGRRASVAQVGPFSGPAKCLLGYRAIGLKHRDAEGDINRWSQLRPRAVNAAAFLSDVRLGREMNMEGQEKYKKQ